MANTVPFSLVLSSPLQCPCGSSCGQFQSSSNKSTSGRRWVLMQHLCQEKFMVRISSSCYLEGAGCQCLLFTQPWVCVGLFLYFPSACPTWLRVPHSHSTPQGGESHSSPSSWAAQHHLDQHQDIPGHHRASANKRQNHIYRLCMQIPHFHPALEGNYHNHSLSGVSPVKSPALSHCISLLRLHEGI